MAAVTLTAVTVTLTGTTTKGTKTLTSGCACTISPTTAEGQLDLDTLIVRVGHASTDTVTLTLGVGTQYSSKGLGTKAISLASTKTIVIGGQDFEGTRFLTSAGTLVFTQTGPGPTTWEAYQQPKATE